MSRVKKEGLKKGRIFVPWIFSFGALLEDLPLNTFLHDPTKVSNALRSIQRHFGLEAIFAYGDAKLLPDALVSLCGSAADRSLSPEECHGLENRMDEVLRNDRLMVALDVTKRLQMLLPETLLTGWLNGPVTLAVRLTGLSAGEVMAQPRLLSVCTKAVLTFARALGETGIDIMIVAEDALPPMDANLARVLTRVYSPIWNTAKYYGFPALLMQKEFGKENVAVLRRTVEALVFPADAEPELWGPAKKISFSIPVSVMEKPPGEIAAYLERSGVGRALDAADLFLLTTEGEIPADVDKEAMIRGIQAIREYLR